MTVKPSSRVLKGGRKYGRGADLERRVKARLEKAGWSCQRAAGSKGIVDLVAWFGREWIDEKGVWRATKARVAFLQVKRDGQISPTDRNNLAYEARKVPSAEAYVVRSDYYLRDVTDWQGSEWVEWQDVF